MHSVSVVTLAGGRPRNLVNLVRGLRQQTMAPTELIVARMQPDPYVLPEVDFPVRQIPVIADPLPLAAARNAAVAAASGTMLVFLDMDCIPTPTLIEDYVRHLTGFDGLLMGEVLYLPGGASDGEWSYEGFAAIGEKHSDRLGPPWEPLEICADYRCFWSLNFAMRRATFLAAGGFDERYVGYGGEDTDFGKTVDQAGIPLAWIRGGLAYHQYHPHHMPPAHHLDSVVRNAELFERKWGYRTMGHWLDAFGLMGLIDNSPVGPIRILRRPNADDLALTGQQSHQPYANAASAIRLLRARAEEAARDAARDQAAE